MRRTLLIIGLAAALPAVAQGMLPNKEPAPSPSDVRAQRGEDRTQGQAPEDRTPSPSDLPRSYRLDNGTFCASAL